VDDVFSALAQFLVRYPELALFLVIAAARTCRFPA
jgi:hypothetical protein